MPLLSHLLKRFEAYVVLAALAFVVLIGGLLWVQASALSVFVVTIAGMGSIQAAIQWADQRRQRQLRAHAIAEIREMLSDQVVNQLAAMKMWMTERPSPEILDLAFRDTDEAIDHVTALIDGLSEEQLDTWKLTYANAAGLLEISMDVHSPSGRMHRLPSAVRGVAARVRARSPRAHALRLAVRARRLASHAGQAHRELWANAARAMPASI